MKDFMGLEPPTVEEKKTEHLIVGAGPGERITVIVPIVSNPKLTTPIVLSRVRAYFLRDSLCALFGIPKEDELNYLG